MTQQYGVVSEENSETSESGTSSVSSSSCGASPATTGSDCGSRRFSLGRPSGSRIHDEADYASGPVRPGPVGHDLPDSSQYADSSHPAGRMRAVGEPLTCYFSVVV